jgi:hypothetical protein
MRTKHDRRLWLLKHFKKTIQVRLFHFDMGRPLWMRGIEIRKAVEVSELSGDTAEVVPNTAQDRVDLGRRFFRECRGQIGASDPVFGQQRSDGSHEPARDISHCVRVGQV